MKNNFYLKYIILIHILVISLIVADYFITTSYLQFPNRRVWIYQTSNEVLRHVVREIILLTVWANVVGLFLRFKKKILFIFNFSPLLTFCYAIYDAFTFGWNELSVGPLLTGILGFPIGFILGLITHFSYRFYTKRIRK